MRLLLQDWLRRHCLLLVIVPAIITAITLATGQPLFFIFFPLISVVLMARESVLRAFDPIYTLPLSKHAIAKTIWIEEVFFPLLLSACILLIEVCLILLGNVPGALLLETAFFIMAGMNYVALSFLLGVLATFQPLGIRRNAVILGGFGTLGGLYGPGSFLVMRIPTEELWTRWWAVPAIAAPILLGLSYFAASRFFDARARTGIKNASSACKKSQRSPKPLPNPRLGMAMPWIVEIRNVLLLLIASYTPSIVIARLFIQYPEPLEEAGIFLMPIAVTSAFSVVLSQFVAWLSELRGLRILPLSRRQLVFRYFLFYFILSCLILACAMIAAQLVGTEALVSKLLFLLALYLGTLFVCGIGYLHTGFILPIFLVLAAYMILIFYPQASETLLHIPPAHAILTCLGLTGAGLLYLNYVLKNCSDAYRRKPATSNQLPRRR